MGSWAGAESMASRVLSAHITGGYTGWTAWGLLFAAYPNLLCQDKGLMYSVTPWGDNPGYQVQPSIWTSAHITQFSEVGWRFLLAGNGTGQDPWGLQYATLVGKTEYSIIVDAFGLTIDSINVTFAVSVPPGAAAWPRRLQRWETNEAEQFVRGSDVMPAANGTFIMELRRGSMYSLTTLPDGAIVKGEREHSEQGSIFPLPHADNFQTLAVGRSPRFFTDWDASFSIEGVGDDGTDALLAAGDRRVLRQQVLQKPIKWHCNDVDPITIIGEGLQNYEVRTTARIEANPLDIDAPADADASADPYVAVYARVQRPYAGWCPAGSGYRLLLTGSGAWAVEIANSVTKGNAWTSLASGTIPGVAVRAWVNLSLACNGSTIRATINGVQVASLQDQTLDSGSAGLGSGYHYAAFDSVAILPLRPTPDAILAPVAVAAATPAPRRLVAVSSFTNVQRTTDMDGWFGMAFTATRAVTVTDVSRYAAGGNAGNHTLRLLRNMTDPQTGKLTVSTLAEASVDYADPRRRLDSSGLVHVALVTPVVLTAGEHYMLVSRETKASDAFFAAASVEPCAGSVGPGGTLPRMVMLTDAIAITGGAMTEDQTMAGGWSLKPDWEPRSYGPVSMAIIAD